MDNYKKKYIKYKKKYLLARQKAGAVSALVGPLTPCCPSHNTIIIKSHGSLIGNDKNPDKFPVTFMLPEGANLITLTNIDNSCPLNKYFDKEIKSFYSQGSTFFEDNDKSTEKTPKCIAFERYVKRIYNQIKIKNHVGPTEVNNHILSFDEKCTIESCSLDCYGLNPPVNNCILKDRFGQNIKTTTLKNIIYDYEGWRRKSYILVACRPIPKTASESVVKLLRQTSASDTDLKT